MEFVKLYNLHEDDDHHASAFVLLEQPDDFARAPAVTAAFAEAVKDFPHLPQHPDVLIGHYEYPRKSQSEERRFLLGVDFG